MSDSKKHVDDTSEESENDESTSSASTLTGNGANVPAMSNGRGTNKSSAMSVGHGQKSGNTKNKGQGVKRKRNGKKNKQPLSSSRYTYSCMVKENHGQPIYGCQFHKNLGDGEPLVFATVGSRRVSIYECTPDGEIKILLAFADPDPDENFYTCAWTDDDEGLPLLAAAGGRGVIRVFSPAVADCVKHYTGHGTAINDLSFHPKDSNLLVSASKDHSLRLWNIKTDVCVAIFGGAEGHRDEVISADIDTTGSRMISCGMDHSLKVWKLNRPEIVKSIEDSYKYTEDSDYSFDTVTQNYPDFTTRDIHCNYVDCAKWYGNFIFSKSCDDSIVCWKGGKIFQSWDDLTLQTTETVVIHRLDISDCDIWFIRFSMDFWKKVLALGNKTGKIYIYDLDVSDPSLIQTSVLSHPKCTSTIRQTTLSRDGSVLICVCDDSTIWRWDSNKENK